MATLTQLLNQYKWGAVGVVGVAAVGGLIWATNRPVEVVIEDAATELAAPLQAETPPVAEIAEAAPVVEEEALAVAAESVAEPVAEVASEATAEIAVEPVAEAAVEPVVEAAAAPAAEVVVEAAVEPVAEAVVEQVVEAAVEPEAEVVVEPETEVAVAPVAEAAAEPVTEAVVVAVQPAAEEVAEAPVVEVASAEPATGTAPSLDLVRVEPGGSAVIAGTAEPNSEVAIKIDGETVATATASAKGEFVAFVETGDEAGTQAIQAVSEGEVGVDLVSADTVLVLTPQAPEGEIAAPAVVSATEQSIKVLQPGGLAVPDQVSLDSISYDKAGEAILAGRAQPLSEVRVYVDDVFAVSGQTTDSGAWEIKLDQVAAGRYILRVDEIGPDGAVTSRASTPFQKEYPENIAPFLQMANGKLTVQPGNTLWVMAREIYGSGIQYTQIFAANKDSIGDPNLIFPGQIFDIPKN